MKTKSLGLSVLESRSGQTWRDTTCLQFDGVNDYVKAPVNIFQLNDYTVEVWIKDFGSQPAASNSQNIIWFTSYASLYIQTNNTFVFFITSTMGANTLLTVNYPVGLNFSVWNHIVIRYTASTKLKEMFINGVLKGSQSISPSIPQALAGNLLLGIGGNFSSNAWLGKISEFRFFTRALSNTEIAYDYNGGNSHLPQSTASLCCWYAFESKSQNLGFLGSDYTPQLFNFSGTFYQPK